MEGKHITSFDKKSGRPQNDNKDSLQTLSRRNVLACMSAHVDSQELESKFLPLYHHKLFSTEGRIKSQISLINPDASSTPPDLDCGIWKIEQI